MTSSSVLIPITYRLFVQSQHHTVSHVPPKIKPSKINPERAVACVVVVTSNWGESLNSIWVRARQLQFKNALILQQKTYCVKQLLVQIKPTWHRSMYSTKIEIVQSWMKLHPMSAVARWNENMHHAPLATKNVLSLPLRLHPPRHRSIYISYQHQNHHRAIIDIRVHLNSTWVCNCDRAIVLHSIASNNTNEFKNALIPTYLLLVQWMSTRYHFIYSTKIKIKINPEP